MQAVWYGDRRDRVKWGGLVHLAKQSKIPCIVQVAFLRGVSHPTLSVNGTGRPLPQAVWDHFSDLRNIQHLGRSIEVDITVIDRPFAPNSRREYIDEVIAELTRVRSPKIIFLDPDTGIAPGSVKAEHVSKEDLREVWGALQTGDMLVVYQHAARSADWLSGPTEKLSEACGGTSVVTIRGREVAKDIALLCCTKGR